MSNQSDGQPTEPLVPGMHPDPVEHAGGDHPGQPSPPAYAAPIDAPGDPRRWSLADAWSGRRPGVFVGLVAAAAVVAVALVGGLVLQASAATHLFSAVGGRMHGPQGQAHGMPGDPDRGPALRGRQRQAPGDGDTAPRKLGAIPGLPGLGQAEHGDVVVGGTGGAAATTVRFVRGQVTAVSATALSLKSADGFTADFIINADTKVRAGRAAGDSPRMRRGAAGNSGAPGNASISDVKVGDNVVVVGELADNTATARVISLVGATGNATVSPTPTGPAT